MRRSLLFSPPQEMDSHIKKLQDQLSSKTEAMLLLQVELAFALMERLGLDDEPVSAVWAVLSGMPIRDYRLQNLDEEGRLAIANARQLIPYSARFSWYNALRDYLRLPEQFRSYNYCLPEEDETIISRAKQPEIYPSRQSLYKSCLTKKLAFYQRELKQPASSGSYSF